MNPLRNDLQVRCGRSEDSNRLAVLAAQVWLDTYATDGISRPIAQYVLDKFTPDTFEALLTDPGIELFVAECGENTVGFSVLKFNTQCSAENGSSVELQTLYVQEPFAHRGIGTALLRSSEVSALNRSKEALWLKVNARNARAIAFYEGHGYAKVGVAHFKLGETLHENLVLLGASQKRSP